MKKLLVFFLLSICISACDTWGTAPQPFPVWSPVPSQTPSIVTATPFILPPPSISTITPTSTSEVITVTPTQFELPTLTLTSTATEVQPVQSVDVQILGCNTSLDIRNGMGEVTNSFVTIRNNGTVDLPNLCGLLRAIDEDREHPDKKRCVDNLPAQHQVTLKLTVDSHYQVDTFIQVDVTSNDSILTRLDQQSCRDISVFGGAPSDVNTIKPIQ